MINRRRLMELVFGTAAATALPVASQAATFKTLGSIPLTDFDMNTDTHPYANRYKQIFWAIERESNILWHKDKVKGRTFTCSTNIASALMMAGVMDMDSVVSSYPGEPNFNNFYIGKCTFIYDVYCDLELKTDIVIVSNGISKRVLRVFNL